MNAYPELKGDLVGLCGYYDGIKSNDWLDRDGVFQVESNPNSPWYINAPAKFSDSWEVW